MRKTILALVLVSVLVGAALYANLYVVQMLNPTLGDDPALWGKRYPLEYESYLRNHQGIAQPYGGSVLISKLENHPEALILYSGTGFSVDFNSSRGHTYSLKDVMATARPRPGGVCLTCKSAAVPRLMEQMGEEEFFRADFASVSSLAAHPVGCANCHRSEDMSLTITNPALLRGLEQLGKDTMQLLRQDMKTLVCAQCHVEYYFAKPDLKLTLPWNGGTDPEAIEEYYTGIGFVDWTHPDLGVGLVKVQHPEYETFAESVHHRLGLGCADCHMPKMTAGNLRYTSHWWTSPLNHLQESCLYCHNTSPGEFRQRVLQIQQTIAQERSEVGESLAALFRRVAVLSAISSYDRALVVSYLVQAHFRWDWVFSENSTGFHNFELTKRLLREARDYIEKAERILD
ncbi:MAG: ammonia-forming cytochrome c nitrite reductase subunit c552 [Bacillota bacterium]